MFKRVNIQFTLNAPAVITEYPYNVIIILVFACGARINKSAIYLFWLRRCEYVVCGVWCSMCICNGRNISNIVTHHGRKRNTKHNKLGNTTSSISMLWLRCRLRITNLYNIFTFFKCWWPVAVCCCCFILFLWNRSQFPFEFRLVHCGV